MTQYIISDPPPIFYHTYETICKGFPSVVWQEQMETAYTGRYNKIHLIKKETPKQNSQTIHLHTISTFTTNT